MTSIRILKGQKKYGSGANEVYALRNISLELPENETCIIIGASGSGKSTLLNIIGGLDTLDSGELFVSGTNVSSFKSDELTEYRRSAVGFVFQFYNLISDLTVEENIKVVSDISVSPLNINEVMNALDIDALRNRFPKELSGGQQQRVAIARALIKNPAVLLCDEITGALDSKSSRDVLKYIQKIGNEFKTTILIITHNENICAMGDRIIKNKDGEIVSNEKNNSVKSVDEMEI